MMKLFTTLLFSAALMASSNSSFETNGFLDSQGNLNLGLAQDVGAMVGQCKSYRISKNPPLIPRLKCRFS